MDSKDNIAGTTRRKPKANMAVQSEETVDLLTAEPAANSTLKDIKLNDAVQGIGPNVLAGLTLAGLGASLLTTVFGLFHVDTFLTAYELPTTTYSVGNVIYSIINTANDVAGAWVIDQIATSRKRSDLVGVTGCLFALCFLTPFFRPWMQASNWFWDGAHFVLSLSLYDTMYSFSMILYSSVVNDDHEMTQATRVRFLAICKVVNLLASFAVARLGLYLFDTDDLTNFRLLLLGLALGVCALSIYSQGLTVGDTSFSLKHWIPKKATKTQQDTSSTTTPIRNLEWRRVAQDFWNHKNFCAWIGMEMLLESQNTFNQFFRKTFIDRLVSENGVDKETCDWLISTMKPVTALVSLAMFIPMRAFGYPKVYRFLFCFNLAIAALVLCVADATSTNWIVGFIIVYPMLTTAVSSAGFGLGMADMVLDMKHMHATSGRFDEPSLAGSFMGANALLCKPMESFLPIVAAQAMSSGDVQQNLFYALVLPPLIFSCLQLVSWSKYTLEPNRVKEMRLELRKLLSQHGDGIGV